MTDSWVITATGVVCAGGDRPADLFERVASGAPLETDGDRGFAVLSVPQFDPRRYLRRKGLKLLSRTSQLACAAASQLRDGLAGVPGDRVGVVFGTAWASLDSVVRFEREAHVEGPRFVDPVLFTETVANVPAGHVSICFGWSALNATVAAGTSSGLEAIGRAVECLDQRRADVVVTGGADELNEHLLRCLDAEGLTAARRASRPFTLAERGPVGAEGACLFTVESEGHARGRGAHALGRVVGTAGGFVDRGEEGVAVRASWLAELLERIDWKKSDIDFLVLSGNGAPARDRAEAATLEAVFGRDVPACVIPKAILGETWGASGPLGVSVALEAIRHGRLPGGPAGIAPSAELPAVSLPERPLERALRRAIVLDCAESGHFAALALRSAH